MNPTNMGLAHGGTKFVNRGEGTNKIHEQGRRNEKHEHAIKGCDSHIVHYVQH